MSDLVNSVSSINDETSNNMENEIPSPDSDEHATQSRSATEQPGANMDDKQDDDIENGQDASNNTENATPRLDSDEHATQSRSTAGQPRENLEGEHVGENQNLPDDEDVIMDDEALAGDDEENEMLQQDEVADDEEENEMDHSEGEEDEESDSGHEGSSEDEEEILNVFHQRAPRHLRQRLREWPRDMLHYLRRVHRYFQIPDEGVAAISNDSETNGDITRPQNITFDRSLPTSHKYLGEMDDCSGIPYIEQETFVVLPIFQVSSFVLVPGQSLPLNITHPREMSLMRAVKSREDKTFGVLLMKNQYDPDTPGKVEIGCTAELRSMRHEEVDEISTMVGIAIGRQRFKVMEERREVDGNITAKVRILSDDDLPPPAFAARLGIHHKLHLLPEKDQKEPSRLRHRNQAKAAWLTRWPPWVHDMYDPRKLREQLVVELKEWNQDLQERSLPTSPTEFSYWVASHLLMTNSMRLYLLTIDNSIQRLRCELNLIRRCTIYECKDCGEEIANKRDVFSMSHGGPMAAYVNPSGHIHETLTVYRSKGLALSTRPSTEHSWFPGYAWAICECSICGRHMGWKFTATKNNLYPLKFWGITRSSLSLRMEPDETKEEEASQLPTTGRRRLNSRGSDTSSVVSTRNVEWTPML